MKSLDKLTARVIQGGMGVGISLGGLAGAVASEGAMGVISTADVGFREHDFEINHKTADKRALVKELRRARSVSGGRGLIAVNAMVAATNFREMVMTACDEDIDAVIAGAGLPLSLPEYVEGCDVLIAPVVSSGKAAGTIVHAWRRRYNRKPDFIVVEGAMAGGHLGFAEDDLRHGRTRSLEDIIRDVICTVPGIPVFAAGGIYDAADVRRVLDLGAYGVQLGTRFIATEECDATQEYKEIIINAASSDIMVLNSPVGMPGRGLKTPLTAAVESGGRFKPAKCLNCIYTCDPGTTAYCITAALRAAWEGDYENGLFFCGENAGRVNAITTVGEIVNELKKGWGE